MYRLMILTIAVGLVLASARCTWTQALPAPSAPVQPTPSVSGTVQQYLLTPHGEVEGLLLSDGTVVKFPPHLGAALASNVKPGDTVTALGFFGPVTPQGRAVKALSPIRILKILFGGAGFVTGLLPTGVYSPD